MTYEFIILLTAAILTFSGCGNNEESTGNMGNQNAVGGLNSYPTGWTPSSTSSTAGEGSLTSQSKQFVDGLGLLNEMAALQNLLYGSGDPTSYLGAALGALPKVLNAVPDEYTAALITLYQAIADEVTALKKERQKARLIQKIRRIGRIIVQFINLASKLVAQAAKEGKGKK